MGKKIWKFLAGVNLTLWLILAAIALLLTGGLYVKANKTGFDPLNHVLLQDWFQAWGIENLDKSWWLPTLILVLALLGINTACCIVDRMIFHWRRRRQTGTRAFLLKIAPTLIHACFGIILAGHFASMCIGYRSASMEFVSRPGETAKYPLPGNVEMLVGEPRCEFFQGPFAGSIRQCRAEVAFSLGGESVHQQVQLAQPLLWNGYQIHMSQLPSKGRAAPYATPEFELLIKRDPGLGLIMACFFILILLTLYYYAEERANDH